MTAFIVAPLLPSMLFLIGTTLLAFCDVTLTAMLLATSYLIEAIVGLPLFGFYRRRSMTSWWPHALGGAVAGLVVVLIPLGGFVAGELSRGPREVLFALIFPALGAVYGFLTGWAWWKIVRPDRSGKDAHHTV